MTIKNAAIFWANNSIFEVRCSVSGRKNEVVGTKKIKFLMLIYAVLILDGKKHHKKGKKRQTCCISMGHLCATICHNP
jgi:hypothetical protein